METERVLAGTKRVFPSKAGAYITTVTGSPSCTYAQYIIMYLAHVPQYDSLGLLQTPISPFARTASLL